MKYLVFTIVSGAVFGLTACQNQSDLPPPQPQDMTVLSADVRDANAKEARSAAQRLGRELKTQLMAAIEADGPVSSIQVCAEIAPALARSISDETGMEIGRTSLRTRNSGNAPDPWETETLQHFQQGFQESANASEMEVSTVELRADGEVVFRWMAPIPMGDVCTTCHGKDISPELIAAIAETYPGDQATGFEPGDLRGAFTVEKVLTP